METRCECCNVQILRMYKSNKHKGSTICSNCKIKRLMEKKQIGKE